MLAYPVANKTWNRRSGDEFEREGEVSSSEVRYICVLISSLIISLA